MPRLPYLDGANHILVIEDLGVQGDLSSAYAGEPLSRQTVDALLEWLAALDCATAPPTFRSDLIERLLR